jgi:membrane protease YdiL (CAAX protease family)
MQRLSKQIGVVVLALAASVAITVVGQGLWGAMVAANLRLTPALPWAAITMPFVLAGLAAFLSGRGWPKAGAAARRALVPLAPVSASAWTWSLISGAIGVVALAALWTVLGSMVRVPPNALANPHGVPLTTLIPILLVSIVAAPITEEIAFRGYAMGLLRRQFGPITALAVSSVMFAAAHLTQGLYAPKLIVYLLVGLGLAAIVLRTGSLLPAMTVHSFGDLTFFTMVWSHDAGRRLISEGGADAGFFVNVAMLIVFSVLWFFTFRQFLKVTRQHPSSAPTAPISGSLAAA